MQTAPGGVLSLDTGTVTGWCYGTDPRVLPAWGKIRVDGMSDLAASFVGIDNEVTDLIGLLRPRKVVYEAALVFKNTPADPRLPLLLVGLAAHVMSACYRASLPCEQIASSTARKDVIGKGTFAKPYHGDGKMRRQSGGEMKLTGDAKEEVRLWIGRIGWDAITDHNARDAALLLRYELMYGSGARVMAGAGSAAA